MSHEGMPTGDEEAEQQNATSEAYYGDQVPEFNPDRAEELKQTAEAESTQEAPAETPVETRADTIPSVKTSEDRLALNRDTYNELARRRAFIKSQYPDFQNAPQTIVDEYDNCGFVMSYLGDGVTAHLHGPLLRDPVGGRRVVIDTFSQDKFNTATRNLTDLKSENATLLDAEAEKNFQLPKIDTESFAQRIEQATTPEEMAKVRQEISEASQDADMDTMFALRELSKDMNSKAGEFQGDEVTNEYSRLQTAVKDAETALQSARDEWEKAGFFKKIGLRLAGKHNLNSLEATLKGAQNAAENYYQQNSAFLKPEQPDT